MDQQGFRNMLLARGLNDAQIDASLKIAERFDAYLHEPGRCPSEDTAWAFSKQLIEDGDNTEENYIALVRYCHFLKENELFVAFLELVDGGEVAGNLYGRLGERFGDEIRDEVYAGIGIAPYGIPTPEKPAYLHPVILNLERQVGKRACSEFLSASLRDLPDEYFLHEREKYAQASDIDTYLQQRKEAFLSNLENCLREGRLFFAQEITPEVIDFVRNDPEMGGGRRVGNIVYETKIPYMTRRYLAETDPVLKRFYACH